MDETIELCGFCEFEINPEDYYMVDGFDEKFCGHDCCEEWVNNNLIIHKTRNIREEIQEQI